MVFKFFPELLYMVMAQRDTVNIKFVPPFQQADVDKYFLHFEKVAGNLKWPKKFWVMLLQSVLVGKAREIYIQLDVEQAANYDMLKGLGHAVLGNFVLFC